MTDHQDEDILCLDLVIRQVRRLFFIRLLTAFIIIVSMAVLIAAPAFPATMTKQTVAIVSDAIRWNWFAMSTDSFTDGQWLIVTCKDWTVP